MLNSWRPFYAEPRRCRDHCDGRSPVEHYTADPHRCTRRCRRHTCRGLGDATILKIHFLISAAYETAVRWEWISINPTTKAKKPSPPPPDPQPPTAEQAAALVNECWRWGDLGIYVWLAMITGARRGELRALRWGHLQAIHAARGHHDCVAAGCRWILTVRRAIAQSIDDGETWEKDTKTHQRRHVALDAETVAILLEHRQRCERPRRNAAARSPTSTSCSPPPQRDRGPQTGLAGAAGFYVVAAMSLPVSMNTSWRFFGNDLHITDLFERSVMFTVLEVALIACGWGMRANVRRTGRPGAPRLFAWLLCGMSGYMAWLLSSPASHSAPHWAS